MLNRHITICQYSKELYPLYVSIIGRRRLEKLIRFFTKLISDKFYGSVELKFEAGRIVLIRLNRTIKLEELGDK
jgi:hypothetical protein